MSQSNLSIRNCAFAFRCEKTWDSLDRLANENVRFCNDCEKNVYFCSNEKELMQAIKTNECVAIKLKGISEFNYSHKESQMYVGSIATYYPDSGLDWEY